MILTGKELKKMYFENLYNKFFDKETGLFKLNLRDFDIESPLRKIKDFEYTYGHNELTGYFFILINEEREGFLWAEISIQEEKNYWKTHKLLITTENFKEIETIFDKKFNRSILRNTRQLSYFPELIGDKEDYIELGMLGNIVFYNPKISKPIKSKLIGLLAIYYLLQKDKVNSIDESRIIKVDLFNREKIPFLTLQIKENIEYIIKKDINFLTILDFHKTDSEIYSERLKGLTPN